MASPDRALVRGLASWDPGGAPVTTLYLDTDGRRYPRRSEYLTRADDLLRSAKDRARRFDRPGFDSACRDVARIRTYLRDEFDRRGTRGVAVFSSSSAGLWNAVPLPQPVRDRASLGPRPDVVPLEALVELAETSCVAIVDREKARTLVTTLGEIEEVTDILDEVPGQHDQGGWAQRRLQRHIEDHVLRHVKRVADSLFRLHQRRRLGDRSRRSGSPPALVRGRPGSPRGRPPPAPGRPPLVRSTAPPHRAPSGPRGRVRTP